MKPTAYLINTSRGPIVVEADLIAALRAGRVAGAGIDVFDLEPPPPDHPFRAMDNVTDRAASRLRHTRDLDGLLYRYVGGGGGVR